MPDFDSKRWRSGFESRGFQFGSVTRRIRGHKEEA
jgi:hypothetical protein